MVDYIIKFDVPADAWGGSFAINRAMSDHHRLLLGVDARLVKGATHEQFFFNGESFTFNLQRKAGGAQTLIGIFAEAPRSGAPPARPAAQACAPPSGWDGCRTGLSEDAGRVERFKRSPQKASAGENPRRAL